MNTARPTLAPVALLLDECRGNNIPLAFVTEFDLTRWEGISEWAIDTCKDPDNEAYWDAWNQVLSHGTFIEDGHTWTLHQDGNLWALCAELMSYEEKQNMGFEDIDPEEFPHEELTARQHLGDLQLTDVQRNDIMHIITGKLKPENWQSVRDRIAECFNRPDDTHLKLTAFNEILEGFGVESFEHKGVTYDYVNQGDSYDATILYSSESGEFFVASWGDVAES